MIMEAMNNKAQPLFTIAHGKSEEMITKGADFFSLSRCDVRMLEV